MVRRKNVALGKVDLLKMSFAFLGSLKNSIPVISFQANVNLILRQNRDTIGNCMKIAIIDEKRRYVAKTRFTMHAP